eukprot:SAG11_NODE_2918_length_2838_cov_0.998175_1_plen_69_part_00
MEPLILPCAADGARAKLAELEEEQEGLSKKINKKVMSMFEKAEQEYQDLLQVCKSRNTARRNKIFCKR